MQSQGSGLVERPYSDARRPYMLTYGDTWLGGQPMMSVFPPKCVPGTSGLSIGAFAIYVTLATWQSPGSGWVNPGPPVEVLAEQVGMDVQDVWEYLSELCGSGWVAVAGTYYYAMWDPADQLCEPEEPPERAAKRSPRPRQETERPAVKHQRMAQIAGRDGGWQCFYCEAPLIPVGEGQPTAMSGAVTATEDHVIPRSRGGGSSLDNLTLACRRCNSIKGTRTLDEWAMAAEVAR